MGLLGGREPPYGSWKESRRAVLYWYCIVTILCPLGMAEPWMDRDLGALQGVVSMDDGSGMGARRERPSGQGGIEWKWGVDH